MEHYSQKDPKWANDKLGTCNTNIKYNGCLISDISMLTNKYTPSEVNEMMTKQGGYDRGCLVNSQKAAKIFKLKYDGRTRTKPDHICIAETLDYDRPSTDYKEQHFFIFAPKGTVSDVADLILDPLNSPDSVIWEENKFKVVSYRLFHENKPVVDTEMQEAIEWNNNYYPKPMVNEFTGETKTDKEIVLMLYRFKNGL